jgi:hypothetical protein
MDPTEISSELSLEPTRSWRKGNQRSTSDGYALEGKYDSTYWSYRVEHDSNVPLANFLDVFTSSIANRRDFFRRIRLTGGTVEYFIGWYSGISSGEVFNCNLLGRLADLQIDLSLDVYCSGGVDSEALE